MTDTSPGSADGAGADSADGGADHWVRWHREYDDPGSALSSRLRAVQRQLEDALDRRADEPVRVVSVCSGDGRDLLDVLGRRPDTDRVRARLLECHPGLADQARERARLLAGVDVRCEDAGHTESYRGAVPADLLLLCGVFGNVSVEDMRATVAALPELCTDRAEVVWTRADDHGAAQAVRDAFAAHGFDEVAFVGPGEDEPGRWRVGVHRLAVPPRHLERDRRLFTFA